MCRLNALKNSALKSRVARSAILVFLPIVKSSFLPANSRACGSDRPSLPKVKGAANENAASLKKPVLSGLKLELLFVCFTPGTTLTRARPVKLHPANNTFSAEVVEHGPYTSVGIPDLYERIPETDQPLTIR